MNLWLKKSIFENISCSQDPATNFVFFYQSCFAYLLFCQKNLCVIGDWNWMSDPITRLHFLKNCVLIRNWNSTSKLFWPHCGCYIGSGLGGSTCDFWIIGPKGSKLVVLILTLILAWMKDGYFDRNIPHYHLCSKSLAAIYNFTITKTLEFSVPGLTIKWGLSFH